MSSAATTAGKTGKRGVPRATSSTTSRATSSAQKLKSKEENYRKMNAKLEEKTAVLVKEVEELMNENGGDGISSTSCGSVKTAGDKGRNDNIKNKKITRRSRPSTTTSGGSCDQLDVAITTDIRRTMKEIEMKYEKENSQTATNNATPADDIITFDETEHLGQDATIRYLKAKLCVMQEEMEQLHRNNKELEKLYSTSEVKVKSLSDQNSKLEKNQQTIQSQMKKYQQLSKTMQDKCEKLEKEVVSLKSELDTEKQTKKKAAVSHSSTEVRLNRALEEVEKYKGTCAKLQTDIKDMAKIEKNKIDSLESRNKLLEKQKKELIAGFHKQMQMIDILKRQKIHLESARMLAFTEEEFVKALNWDKKD